MQGFSDYFLINLQKNIYNILKNSAITLAQGF